jgi:hypothetical protein
MSTLFKAGIKHGGLYGAALFRATHGACPECGDYFIPKPAPTFYINEGFGFSWEVRYDCGLCPRCLEALRQEKAGKWPKHRRPMVVGSPYTTYDFDTIPRECVAHYETGTYPAEYTGISCKNEYDPCLM